MAGIRPIVRVGVSIALLCSASCKYDSSFTKASAEWDPQLRARDDAIRVGGGADTTDESSAHTNVTVLRPSASAQPARNWTLDPLYILSFPVYVIWDGLLHVVMTDTDPKWRPRFETRLFYANPAAGSAAGAKTSANTDSTAVPTKADAPSADASTKSAVGAGGNSTPPTAAKPTTNPDPGNGRIRDDEVFEVHLTYLAIDYFTGGRLRDAWGGQGGQVSVQTSLNALSNRGMLVSEDTKFVVENEVKRRSPLLAFAQATEKGRDFVDELTGRAKAVLEKANDLELTVAKIQYYLDEIKKVTGKDPNDAGARAAARAARLEELRKAASDLIDTKIPGLFKNADEQKLALQVAHSISKSIFDDISNHLNDADLDTASDWVAKVTNLVQRHLDEANVVLEYFGRYGVDEQGIYETAKIIVGLADADRRSTLDFENVKPSLIQFGGEASGGTAATLLGDDRNSDGKRVLDGTYWKLDQTAASDPKPATSSAAAQGKANKNPQFAGDDTFHVEPRELKIDRPDDSGNTVVSERGLVYRGTLRELSRTMTDVKGFSLSFLMIDRGDDRVVRALRSLQQYTNQSGLTIGGGGTQIQVSAIVDGLATLAEKISEDKVELRTIDLRFMGTRPPDGSTPGHELFALRPCTILISRNLNGNKFGAVAEITIARSK